MQTILGKYEIRAQISQGPMSTVYDGWDTAIDRRVAIKAVPLAQTSQSDGWQHLTRFRREAQAAGRLQHPAVVAIFDYGETAESAFIIMEFVDGGTLKSALEAGTRFSISEVDRLMQDILAGLRYSHDRGIVHRDIKPANIMLTGDGHAKIADFGIARVEHSDITQVGMIMGTPAYMSPEQFRGEAINPSTDIYSAGVILYQLLTGERPFDGGLATIMHKALSTEPPKPSDVSPRAPRSVDGVVARAMAKQPEQRFRDATEFAQALKDALATNNAEPAIRSIAAQRTHGPPRRVTRPSYVQLGVGALLLTLAAGGIAGYRMLASRAAPKTQEAQRPAPSATQTAASPEPPKRAIPANDAVPPGSAAPAAPAPMPHAAPLDLPNEQSMASREALSARPASPPPASLPLVPDLLSRDAVPTPLIYPVPQAIPAPSMPNASTDPQKSLRSPRKDGPASLPRPQSRPPAGPRTDGNSASTMPWTNQTDRYRADRLPKDAPDEADLTKPTGKDTAPGPRRTPQPDRKAAANNPAIADVNGQRTLNPANSSSAQVPSTNHDSAGPTPQPETAPPPRFLGTYGIVNGVLRFTPAAPESAK